MIKKIAITGGPCSGKSTGIEYISEKLWDFGYRPIVAPEIPTLVIANGVPDINKIASSNSELYLEIHRTMFLLESDYEKRINNLAEHFQKNEKVVILCDRGKIDGRAYVNADSFSN